jgi:hypothetical protein
MLRRYLFCLLLFSSLEAGAGERKTKFAVGDIYLECVPPIILHLDLPVLSEPVHLIYWGEAMSPPTHRELHFMQCDHTQAMECSSKFKDATITFDRFDIRSGAAGSYAIPHDGQMLRGKFYAIAPHVEGPILCE